MKRITEYDNITTVSESDVLPIVDVSDTEQASTGSTRKGSIEKIADYIKARTETLTNKTLTSPVLNTPDINTPDIDGGTIGGATINSGSIGSDTNVVEVLKKVYPVGSIYISVTSTNPATVFGFGTWSAFGEGRTLLGIGNNGTTNYTTVEATGGVETVTLTSAQSGVPAHTHTLMTNGTPPTATAGKMAIGNASVVDSATTAANTAANASQAHTNLQPYIVTYMFKRAA